MELHTLAPHESRMCLLILGSKGQGHGASEIENSFRTITDYEYVIHLWSWNFIHLLLMGQGCDLLILGSKVIWDWNSQGCSIFIQRFWNSDFCIFDAPFTCTYLKLNSTYLESKPRLNSFFTLGNGYSLREINLSGVQFNLSGIQFESG